MHCGKNKSMSPEWQYVCFIPGSSDEKRLTTIPTSLPWPIPIKEEPEDLTGRSANHASTLAQHTDGAESDTDSNSSGDQVLYIADDSALIGEVCLQG